MGKENKSKNASQNDDPDESDNNSMKIVKFTKNIKDEDRNITKKCIFYLMLNKIWRKLKKENE